MKKWPQCSIMLLWVAVASSVTFAGHWGDGRMWAEPPVEQTNTSGGVDAYAMAHADLICSLSLIAKVSGDAWAEAWGSYHAYGGRGWVPDNPQDYPGPITLLAAEVITCTAAANAALNAGGNAWTSHDIEGQTQCLYVFAPNTGTESWMDEPASYYTQSGTPGYETLESWYAYVRGCVAGINAMNGGHTEWHLAKWWMSDQCVRDRYSPYDIFFPEEFQAQGHVWAQANGIATQASVLIVVETSYRT